MNLRRGLAKITTVIMTAVFVFAAQVAWAAPILGGIADAYPRQEGEFEAAVVYDARSGKLLYAHNANKRWPAASLTKLMGAIVFSELNPKWSRVVTIKSVDEVGGGRLRVSPGSSLRLVDLLYSSLVGSANNAATALARLSGLGYQGFVKAMNNKAKALGLKTTKFVDPSGMDPANVTTADDVAHLVMVAFKLPAIRMPATTATYRFTVRNTGAKKEVKNTNKLLTEPVYDDVYVTGGKTGFLYESRYNLAVQLRPGLALRDRELVIVVLGAPTKDASFESAHRLAKWAWMAYDWTP